MAWIKLDHFTPDKPEIVQVASILGIDHDAVLGKCIRLWIWADQQSISGNALSVTKAFLDRMVNVTGFADALQKSGWLTIKNGLFCFPNFDRHNGKSAKKRAQTANRAETFRNARSVTKALPDKSKIRINSLPRPRNELFDALVTAFFNGAGISKSDASRIGKMAAELKERGAAPGEVAAKKALYKKLHPDWACTPDAVVKHWHSLAETEKPYVPSF